MSCHHYKPLYKVFSVHRFWKFLRIRPKVLTVNITFSYLHNFAQLYMETIQDLLDPSNDNISIVEDPKTGDVSLPGASLVEVRDQQSFLELLRIGEAHRFAANTKLNTESSRSHAILMVNNLFKIAAGT